ncbi:protein PSK SIMULATOR 3-like [Silene latifolia]|uniref:protein PSK SIMULATOR 3-like n=1 Tax=Silene latifolia TaxID=37657 RepID=UPI003D776D81
MGVGSIHWLSDPRPSKNNHNHNRNQKHHNHNHDAWMFRNEKLDTLGILAFDTAKAMSRLVSLYKSISQKEIERLKNEAFKSKGISFLISQDEGFLLTLACAERLEDLDRAATAVARLGLKCSDYGLVRFGQVYKDLKAGYIDMEKLNDYGCKEVEKYVDKMEKFTSLTGQLYAELESLAELETSERKLNEWRKGNGSKGMNYDLFDQKVVNQRKLVRHLKEVSLWNQCYDKIVGIMAKMVCVLYARTCNLFGPHFCHKTYFENAMFNRPTPKKSMSGPIYGSAPKGPLVRFLSQDSNVFVTEPVEFRSSTSLLKHKTKVFNSAPTSTVGGSGLANRYANVILLSAKYLYTDSLIGDNARDQLYNMLPVSLKTYVRSKLRVAWKMEDGDDEEMAEGWRVALNEILGWLVPMAQDTLTWQTERNYEKQRFDAKPTVLLMQTLHYADLEKCEVVIAEVLVGLSCVFWYENRRISDIY